MHVVFFHLVRQHLRVDLRRRGRNGSPKQALNVGSGSLSQPAPCPPLGGVPVMKWYIACSRRQLADRRQHAERVARQEDDVLGVPADRRDMALGM